jgi:hypothetical protein
MSLVERTALLVEQYNPLWMLPEWIGNAIVTCFKGMLAVATMLAFVLYRNQVPCACS